MGETELMEEYKYLCSQLICIPGSMICHRDISDNSGGYCSFLKWVNWFCLIVYLVAHICSTLHALITNLLILFVPGFNFRTWVEKEMLWWQWSGNHTETQHCVWFPYLGSSWAPIRGRHLWALKLVAACSSLVCLTLLPFLWVAHRESPSPTPLRGKHARKQDPFVQKQKRLIAICVLLFWWMFGCFS